MTALDQVTNFAKATVSVGYGSAATSIVLASGQGAKFPAASVGAYNLVWWNATDFPDPSDDPAVEIIRVTNGGGSDGDTLTIVRAQEGTVASNKLNLNKIYKMQLALTAKMISDILSQTGVYAETPTGLIDGTNVTYTASKYITSVLMLAINGQYFFPTDFSFSANTITLGTALDASLAGTAFTVVYQGFSFNSEIPTGTIDGVNRIYSVANPINRVINISINGEFVHPVEYTTSGKTVTFLTPLDPSLSGAQFTINYI
jgi:hypothetical protein